MDIQDDIPTIEINGRRYRELTFLELKIFEEERDKEKEGIPNLFGRWVIERDGRMFVEDERGLGE